MGFREVSRDKIPWVPPGDPQVPIKSREVPRYTSEIPWVPPGRSLVSLEFSRGLTGSTRISYELGKKAPFCRCS